MTIKVLIADDHEVLAEGLQSLVDAQSELKVVGRAASGHEAIERALELQPDVIVMDMAMPGMNGIEATRVLQQRVPRVNVVMLSMYSNVEYVIRALEAGAKGFVVKRAAAREVVQAIRAVHAGRRYLGATLADSVINHYLNKARPMDPLAALTARERQVLQLLAESKSTTEIARTLNVSPKTVETYRARLYVKLQVHDLPSLVRFAIQHGLTSLE